MIKKKVFARLKTKAASFGFNGEELRGIAATIADNLDSEEATDEDIDAQIDAVLPLLKVGQQQAQRIAKTKTTTPTKTGDDEEDDDDDDPSATGKKSNKKTEKENDGTPEWAKGLLKTVETLNGEITALKGEKVTSTRRSKLEGILKDTGKFGERTLKNFSKMKFETDEEFEEYLSDVESDLEDENQEQGNETISTVTKPVGGGDRKPKEKPLSDAEIEEIVASVH